VAAVAAAVERVRKRFLRHFILKPIFLPRQARDKHRKVKVEEKHVSAEGGNSSYYKPKARPDDTLFCGAVLKIKGDLLPRQAQDECKRRQQLKKGGAVYLCCCCLQVFDDKAFAEWLVTNFGTGAALYGQTNASAASFDTVGTLLKTYASLSVHLEPVLAN
jgi:hypothetical protein